MMDPKSLPDGGGPAFPLHPDIRDDEPHAGMSLRDYFATHCDIGDVDQLSVHFGVGLLGRHPPMPHDDPLGCMQWWAEYRACLRYIEADAMVKARGGAQ